MTRPCASLNTVWSLYQFILVYRPFFCSNSSLWWAELGHIGGTGNGGRKGALLFKFHSKVREVQGEGAKVIVWGVCMPKNILIKFFHWSERWWQKKANKPRQVSAEIPKTYPNTDNMELTEAHLPLISCFELFSSDFMAIYVYLWLAMLNVIFLRTIAEHTKIIGDILGHTWVWAASLFALPFSFSPSSLYTSWFLHLESELVKLSEALLLWVSINIA